MKISNKVIKFRLKADDENGVMQAIDETTDLQMPSIEKITDSIKGAGIMGEIDFPVYGQISSMVFTVNHKDDDPKYAMLSRPGAIRFEVFWTVDTMESGNIRISTQQNKVFMTGINKKYDPGKIEVGASMDGSSEFEIVYYRKITDGKEVLLIDKLNYKYVVNGKDYMEQIRAAFD